MTRPKRRILLVDDEPDILELVGERLEASDCDVTVAMDGQVALMRAQQELPDLIILDIMLPKLNGYEVCTMLKQDQRTRHIPIILFSAKAEEADYWRGRACGADAYLTKPSRLQDLEILVNRLIELLGPQVSSS